MRANKKHRSGLRLPMYTKQLVYSEQYIKNPAIKRGFLYICARRESNPHFQLRRLTLYPLNYERDKAVVSFILQNYARALEKNSKKLTTPTFRTGPFFGVPISTQGPFPGASVEKSQKSGVGGFWARAEFARKTQTNSQ